MASLGSPWLDGRCGSPAQCAGSSGQGHVAECARGARLLLMQQALSLASGSSFILELLPYALDGIAIFLLAQNRTQADLFCGTAGSGSCPGVNHKCRYRILRLALPEPHSVCPALQGKHTVPHIFIGGQFVGGADELDALESSGQLAARLGA